MNFYRARSQLGEIMQLLRQAKYAIKTLMDVAASTPCFSNQQDNKPGVFWESMISPPHNHPP